MSNENNAEKVISILDKLTREELILLNQAIVKRIRIMDDLHRIKANAAFNPGDFVSWHDNYGNYRTDHVIRINTKTISVEEDGDPEGIWRIPASRLYKMD